MESGKLCHSRRAAGNENRMYDKVDRHDAVNLYGIPIDNGGNLISGTTEY